MFFNEGMEYRGTALNVEPSETGLTPDQAGVYRMIAESTEDWYNLREKMMKVEHVSIIREDAELLSEGAKDFFGKISGFFKKMLAKIKEIWQKFTVWISNSVMHDKEFIKKYEKVLRNKSFAGFETKGHKWKTGELGDHLNFDNVLRFAEKGMGVVKSTRSNEAVTKLRENYDESADQVIHGLIVGGGKVDDEDFREAIRKGFFEGGDTEVVDLETKDLPVGTLMEVVKSAEKNIKSAQKEEKAIEKLLEDAAKFFDGIAKKLEAPGSDKNSKEGAKGTRIMSYDGKNSEKEGHQLNISGGNVGWKENKTEGEEDRTSQREAASIVAQVCRKASTISSSAFGQLIGAIKERRSEFRGHLAKMVTYKPKSENYDFMSEGTGILDQF